MADESNTNKDSILLKMLETRENHARKQYKNYSHVFRKKSYFEILRLTCGAFGVGLVMAATTAFVSPTLLEIGVDYSSMTMVWGLSPVLGLVLGPLIGSMSDRCRLNMGRRRPALLFLSVIMIVGLILLPYGKNIGRFFGDDPFDVIPVLSKNITETTQYASTATPLPTYKPNLNFAILFIVLGTMLVDFNGEMFQSPGRAYIVDVCIPQDHGKALSTLSVMAGLGMTLGYLISGINWETTALGRLLGGNIPAVFMIVTIFFVVCFPITIFSFREVPLPLIERDYMLRPVTAAVIENEYLKTINSINSDQKLMAIKTPVCCDRSLSIDAGIIETVSLAKYLKSVIVMPRSMWILSLTNLLSWMGQICYCLYFTDFVGEAVFHGDPTAPEGSEENKLYEAGVRFGCWGMAAYALTISVYSFIVERLLIWFKPKYVFVFGIMVFAIGMFILARWPSKLGVLILSITAGIFCGTMFTIPYIIAANYHSKSCFEVSNGENVLMKEPRGVGTDMAIITSMLFIAQLVMSLSIGYVVTWSGTTSAIFYVSSALSVCAAVSAMFVLYI